jgi:methyl-accepting chemotaxis protein
MFKDLKIGTKLKLNLVVIILGLLILGTNMFFSIQKTKKEYKITSELASQTSGLKSILIGGLLYNSATGVVLQNPTKQKAKKSMKMGYKKVEDFGKNCSAISPKIYSKIYNELMAFVKNAKYMHKKAINNKKFTKQDMKRSLKTWRTLKFKIMPELKILKKKSKISNIEYHDIVESMLINFLIIISIITILVVLISSFIAQSIRRPIEILTNSVIALMEYSSANQEISVGTNDEIGELAKHFNTYMLKLRETMSQDQLVVEEVDKAIQMARSGFFVYTVDAVTNNRSTNDLKNSVNSMIKDLNEKFTTINDALIQYGNANFNHTFEVHNTSGTIGSIAFGTKAIGNNVSELLATILLSGEQLTSNIQTLLHSSGSLSRSANAQAASLEETATAVEEISSNIQSSSQNIAQMSLLSKEVTNSATVGEQLATQTSTAMDDINTQVTAISDAITVIDQIAFQTNILSLNAAVEAATAGEAGKGFAVVAQEVRNLASRSAEAANEIKTLVDSANTKAKAGKDIANEMINGYLSLNEKIQQNQDMIDMITDASREQTRGIAQINDAVGIIDSNTQKNASDATVIENLASDIKKLSDKLMNVASNATYREEARQEVCDTNLVNELNKLKLDHLIFKNTNFAKLNERTSFSVANEHECALGDWIKQMEQDNAYITQTANWTHLKEEHHLVHANVQKYITQNAKNDSNEHLIEIANDIEDATNKVFSSLNVVKKEFCQNINKG